MADTPRTTAAEAQHLLRLTEAYLTLTHANGRHDTIGTQGSCAGCALRDHTRALIHRIALETRPTVQPDPAPVRAVDTLTLPDTTPEPGRV